MGVGDAKVLKTANGAPLHVLGKVNLDIKINGLITSYDFVVLDGIHQDVLIGFDYLLDKSMQHRFCGEKTDCM